MANKQRESGKKQVIAIIGAGISGLLACKYSLSKGFDPIVFESESSIGGVWTKTIESTKLQTPKPFYQFSDFPWPDSVTEVFPDQHTVLEYIESYVRHFDLLRNIQFNTKVLSLGYESGGDSVGELNLWGGAGAGAGVPFSTKGKWNITVQDTQTLSIKSDLWSPPIQRSHVLLSSPTAQILSHREMAAKLNKEVLKRHQRRRRCFNE